MGSIPIGGQLDPSSTAGLRELWKYAQKIAKKKNASETIKRATPMFIPF